MNILRLRLWLFIVGLMVLNLTAHAATNLPIGKVTTGAINSAAQINKYSFSANTGDVIDFAVYATTSGNLDPFIQVFTADSSTPFASAENVFTGCEGGPVPLNSVTLPASTGGVYYVWISDCASTNTGGYDIYLQRTNNPAGAKSLSLDQTTQGSITSAVASDTYTIAGTKNEVLVLSAIATSGSLIPRFRLYNPDGSLLSAAENVFTGCSGGELEMNPISLPTTGTYTLMFGDCNDINPGNYSIFAQSSNMPAGPVTDLLWGEIQPGTVNAVGGLVQETTYAFQGTSGDQIDLTVAVNSGNLLPRVRIYNPDGSLFYSAENTFTGCAGGPLQIQNLAIKTTGNFVVFLDDCNHVNGGSYTVSSQCFGVCLLPAPVITSIVPNVRLVGSAGFNLTVNGANFVNANAQSVVQWNGADLQTTFVNTGQLTAAVPITDLAIAGCVPVTVFTPAPGGGTSNSKQFCVNNPKPILTSLVPSSALAGGPGFTLTLNGSGFVPGSVVTWNSVALATTFVSASQLTAAVLASDIAIGGSAAVAVSNAAPGGGTASLTFTIPNPSPVLTGISPVSITSGGSTAATVTLNGSGFVANSSVQWNGAGLVTTFVSGTQLKASIPIDDTACGSVDSITVFNGAPGGGTSGSKTFTVNNPVPTTSSISPASTPGGGAGFTLTVNGSKFRSCSVIQWNGTSLATTFASPTKLTASVPASGIANPGTANITVLNPVPAGGISSPAIPFIIGPYPVPTMTSIAPASVIAGRSAFTLTVNGTNFVQGSTVDWDAVALKTTFVSSTELTALVAMADVATAGTADVTVVNPSPGGGPSSAQLFTINNPVPAVTSISPVSTAAQGPAFTLTVNGSKFVPTSTVEWNGGPLNTIYVTASQLTATVSATAIAAQGTAAVTVKNPTPGGGTSSPATFTITNPQAATPSINPAPGSYGAGQLISINDATSNTTIYYTRDGTTPTTASPQYKTPFLITASVTVQAIAVAAGSTQSLPASAAYTIGGSPVVLTLPAVALATSGGTVKAIVNGEGLAGQMSFKYGTSSSALTSTTPVVTLGASTKAQSIQAVLTGLTPNTTYYYQPVVTTAGGTSSGAVLSFMTP